jgi:acetyl-CoA carboxylase, biotin carboxylase subunit
MFKKVLVANRGEIAVRVMRALRELRIASVAVYSEADRGALHVQMADEAVPIGPAPSSESYLRVDRILNAAGRTGAQAIHPGYGFLSENADFAAACAAAGVKFIGPPASAIRAMGSKTAARQLAEQAGVPLAPGTKEPMRDAETARARAREIGYPVLLKAAAGGGGKGMRRVDREEDLAAALRDASSEAERSFQSSDVYLEKLIVNPRHIEIQVLGDEHGHLIHLGERECSLQRRHQKVIEECPSPFVAARPGLREAMGAAAVKAARAAGYANAGTVEFLVEESGAFYFLEMNTRLQVEHPVTELATGLDLVHWQLRIASGERLTLQQSDIRWQGWAMECRVYAEDPENGYLPSPGRMRQHSVPAGPGIRLDSGVYDGWTVPLDYDPMLAKLAAWGETRAAAAERLHRALGEYVISGIRTNTAFFREVLRDAEFLAGRIHTGFLDEFAARRPGKIADPALQAIVAAVAALHREKPASAQPATPVSAWRARGQEALLR